MDGNCALKRICAALMLSVSSLYDKSISLSVSHRPRASIHQLIKGPESLSDTSIGSCIITFNQFICECLKKKGWSHGNSVPIIITYTGHCTHHYDHIFPYLPAEGQHQADPETQNLQISVLSLILKFNIAALTLAYYVHIYAQACLF